MRTVTDLKRQEILKAAAAVFAKRGFQKTLMEDVAGQAGIGKGTIYRYFSSKDDLYFSILDQAVEDLLTCLSLDLESKASPEQKLRKMMSDMADLLLKNRSLFKLIAETGARDMHKRHKSIHLQNKKIIDSIAKVIEKGIKEGHFIRESPRLLAIQLAVMTKATVMEFSGQGKDKIVDRIMELFLYGAAKNGKHLHR
jgi:AcrR family transcriptional regulator